MGIKSYNPYTPSRRHMTGSDFSEITKATPEKSLTVSLKKNAGRNNQGKITVRHQGGGSRRKYRIIDFKRRKDGIPAVVKSVEYDPNRTANIALICYADGEKAYILAPEGLKVGQKVMNGPEAEIRVGNCLPLELIPVGTMVHNRTANCRSDSHVTLTASFTDVDQVVITISDDTNCSTADDRNHSHLTRWETKCSVFAFFSHKLSTITSGTNHLSALSWVKLNVMNHSTNRDKL